MKISTILTESQNYKEMLSKFEIAFDNAIEVAEREEDKDFLSSFWIDFENELSFTVLQFRVFLNNKDRMHWFLKYIRSYASLAVKSYVSSDLGNLYTDFSAGEMDYPILEDPSKMILKSRSIRKLYNELKHFTGVAEQSEEVSRIKYGNKPLKALIEELERAEKIWQTKKKTQDQIIPEDGEKIIDFGNGWAWWKLDKAECSVEGNSMGHCGNQYGDPDQRILSLRKRMKGGYRPSLTFILNADGTLGEMKGRANLKPKKEYHPYIIRLLENPIIKGIIGGGHDPANNFAVTDLTESEQQKLYELKPALMPAKEQYKRSGMTETVKAYINSRMPHEYLKVSNEFDAVDATKYFGGPFENELGAMLALFYDPEQVTDTLYGYYESDSYSDHWTWMVNDIPQAYLDKIVEVISEKYRDDFINEYDEDSLDHEETCIKYFCETLDQDGICGQAYYDGVASSYQDEILKEIKSSFDGIDALSIEVVDFPSTPEFGLLISIDNKLWKFCEEEESEQDGILDSMKIISMSYDENHTGFDEDAAARYFIENIDDEFVPDIPNMPPVNTMNIKDIATEMGKTADELIDSHQRYASRNITILDYARSSLLRYRKKQYGVETKLTESLMERQIHDVASVVPTRPDANFWIVRNGNAEEVGRPVKEYSPNHLGVTIMTDDIDEEYLYYYMMSLHLTNRMGEMSTRGGADQYTISAHDVRNIKID